LLQAMESECIRERLDISHTLVISSSHESRCSRENVLYGVCGNEGLDGSRLRG
jgi:hypothetical protein